MKLVGEELGFSYGRRVVLQDVHLEARKGEVTVIVGPNGVGKTTLLRLLSGILQPQTGRVLLAEEDIRRLSRRDLARKMAMAPQLEIPTWPLSVLQMVLLGRTPHRGWWLPLNSEDQAIARRALQATALEHLADRAVTELSGGELRRAIFARILAQEPKVVILDEPTAHLDLRHQEEVLGRLQALSRDQSVTVVVTLHDLNQAATFADRIALLHGTGLRAVGTPEEVLTPEHLEEAYEIPISVARHPGSDRLWVTPCRPESSPLGQDVDR